MENTITLASIATLLVMIVVLQRVDKLRHLPLVALSPLLILETGVGGHLDALTTLAVALALLCWVQSALCHWRNSYWAWCSIKFLPLVLLGPLVLLSQNVRKASILVLGFVLTVFGGYIIAFFSGWQLIGSLSVFFEKWRFSSPLHAAIEYFAIGQYELVLLAMLAACSFSAIAFWCWRKRSATFAVQSSALQWTIATPLLLSPVVFPWYLMPLVVVVALRPSPFFLIWFSAFPVVYEVIGQYACCGVYQPKAWPQFVLTVALLAGLISEILYRIHRNKQGACTHEFGVCREHFSISKMGSWLSLRCCCIAMTGCIGERKDRYLKVIASEDIEIQAGESATLSARFVGSLNDEVLQWRQIEGPPVTITATGETTATLLFLNKHRQHLWF